MLGDVSKLVGVVDTLCPITELHSPRGQNHLGFSLSLCRGMDGGRLSLCSCMIPQSWVPLRRTVLVQLGQVWLGLKDGGAMGWEEFSHTALWVLEPKASRTNKAASVGSK